MHPIDAWWNRHFPAHSVNRLVFFWVVTPFIAGAVGLVWKGAGGELTWARFWLTTTSVWVMTTLSWYLARSGYVAPRAARSRGRLGRGTDGLPPEPGSPRAPGEGELPLSDAEIHGLLRSDVGPRGYRKTPRELVISGAMLYASFLVSTALIWPEGAWTPGHLGLSLVASGLCLLVIATSFSLFALTVVALVISYPAAFILRLFFLFLSDNDSIWSYWLMTFLFAESGAISIWIHTRVLTTQRHLLRVPVWAISLGTSLLLLLATAAASGDVDVEADRLGESASAAGVDPTPAVQHSGPQGAATPESAASQLLQAWRAGSRDGARAVAHETTVAALFGFPVDPQTHLRGCGVLAGSLRCVLVTPSQMILLALGQTPNRSFIVTYAQWVPSDHPVEFEGSPGATPDAATPSPSS